MQHTFLYILTVAILLVGCGRKDFSREEIACASCFDSHQFYTSKQSETDVIARHLSRITGLPAYHNELKCYDQFILIEYPGILTNEKDYLCSARKFDFMDDDDFHAAAAFAAKVNKVIISGEKSENYDLEGILTEKNDNEMLSMPSTNVSFLPVFSYPADTIVKWQQINYRSYLNLLLVNDGSRVGNMQFPRDSISCEIATIALNRNIRSYTPKMALRKGTYAAITKVILIKNLRLEIYSDEPVITYDPGQNTYTVSTKAINRFPVPTTAVAYVCSIFYKK